MALLAGDGLLTEAFHRLSSAEATRGATPELVVPAIHDLARLSRYGEYLGLAFLSADDILDSHGGEFGTAAESSPKEAKKASYPSVVGIVIARSSAGSF